jgi:hypothetical protein
MSGRERTACLLVVAASLLSLGSDAFYTAVPQQGFGVGGARRRRSSDHDHGGVRPVAVPTRRRRPQQQQHPPFGTSATRHNKNKFAPSATTTTTTTQLHMALIPLSVNELERLISSSGKPTGAQYATYWGRTTKERYGRFVESATVGFLGVFFSYFLSFVLGGFVATILGCLFFFWGVLSPEFKAYQRNWEFLGGRQLVDLEQVTEQGIDDPDRAGLYGALLLGRIADVCVVEDTNDDADAEYDLAEFADYTMETDELDRYTGQPYLLRVQCADQQGRTLQIHCRLTEDYLHLHPGMPATTLLLSTSPKFTKLAALTDVFVLPNKDDEEDAGCWIGDYPYLNQPELEALLADDDDLWDALQEEAVLLKDSDKGYFGSSFGKRDPIYASDDLGPDSNDDDYSSDSNRRETPVPVKRRGRR